MELIIKGKKIEYICTLHLTEFCSQEDGDHDASFVIYNEYDEIAKKDVKRVMYFRKEDIDCLKWETIPPQT